MLKMLITIYQRVLWTPAKYAKQIRVDIEKNCIIRARGFRSERYLITVGDNVIVTADVRF